jgi:hypothetical protein
MKCPHCGGALKLAADLGEIEGELAILPFPVLKYATGGNPVVPPRKYSTVRPVEPNRAAEAA